MHNSRIKYFLLIILILSSISIFTWWRPKTSQTADITPKEECNITKAQAINIVNKLPEVKKYFQNSNPSTEKQISTPTITADDETPSLITVHVYSLEEYPSYPEILSHTGTFNRYQVDKCTGQIKCSFSIYDENGKFERVSEGNEYPCNDGQKISIQTKEEAMEILKQKVSLGKIFEEWIENPCVQIWIDEGDDYYQVEIHEKKLDNQQCPGDPNVSPLLALFKLNKHSREVTLYDIINDKYNLVE